MAAKVKSIDVAIRRALNRRPFRPFVIVATSGDRYGVSGRHQVAVGKQMVVILPPDRTSIYLRASQIVALELAAPAV